MKRYPVNIPENKIGDYEIVHARNGVTHLMMNNRSIMSDDDQEHKEHQHFLPNAYGHILSAGLGISMIHKPLMDNENFKSLTVVERSQEVIDLVWDHCHKDERFKIVHSDIYDYVPTQKFDIGWFDSWIGEEPGGSRAENYPYYSEIYEMDMKEKFGKHCTKLLFWKSIHSPKN